MSSLRYNLMKNGTLIAQFVKRVDAERIGLELSLADAAECQITDNAGAFTKTVIKRGAFAELGEQINGRITC